MAKYQATIGNTTSTVTDNDHDAVMQVINGREPWEKIHVEYVYAYGKTSVYVCTVRQYLRDIS